MMNKFLRKLLVLSCLFANVLLTAFRYPSKPDYRLRLLVAEDGGTAMFSSSRYYSGTLVNDGSKPESLEAIEMPGGYQGAGRFFPCTIQVWDHHKKTWTTPHPSKLSEQYWEQIVSVSIAPHGQLEVCKNLLPQQAGHVGDSV